MYTASPGAGSGLVAVLADASPRRWLNGQHALMAVIAGVTWLALVGSILSAYILGGATGGASSHYTPPFAAYDMQEVVPTSYGSISVIAAELTPVADSVDVHVSVRAENKQDGPVGAPRVEDLRLINTGGAEARPKPGEWSGPAIMVAHSTANIDVTFQAAQGMGLLWLQYQESVARYPIRFALGAVRAPLPAAAVGVGEVQ
jgi:hypothetical protein